jgi:O-antigen/teichoic acid export membrane protein
LTGKGSPPVDVLDAPAAGMLVIRGGALRGGAYLLGIGLSLVSVPLMTRHLGTIDYGRIATVMALIALVASLTDGGLTAVGVREYSVRQRDEHRSLMRAIVGLRMTLTLAGVAAALVFAGAIGYDAVLVAGTCLAGIGLLVGTVQKALTIPMTSSLRLGTVAGIQLVEQSTLVAFVTLLVLAGAGIAPFFAIYLVSGFVALVATIAVAGWTLPLPTVDLSMWRTLLRDMLPYGAATAISATGVVLIAMPLLVTDTEVGYFALAAQVTTVLLGVWAVVSVSTLPVLARAARDDRARLTYVVERTLHTALVLGVGVSALTVVGAELAIRVLAGPEFEDATPVLQILAPTLAVGYAIAVWTLTLIALGRARRVLAVNLAGLAATLALAFSLVPTHGAMGAAIAVLAGQMLTFVAFAVSLGRLELGLVRMWRLLVLVVVTASLAVVVGTLMPVPTVIAMTIAAGLYAGALMSLGAVPPELLDLVMRRGDAPSDE